jgi:hypothetical protein
MGKGIDDPSFENALGPLQGSSPDSYFTAPFINAARFGGELLNYAEGGAASSSKVRSDVIGGSDALAAAIKPLIRKPGEGTWTDADQAMLRRIVGELEQSRSKEEFYQRLDSITDRLNSNYNLKLSYGAAPNDKSKLVSGRIYTSPSGQRGRWNGTTFDLVD